MYFSKDLNFYSLLVQKLIIKNSRMTRLIDKSLTLFTMQNIIYREGRGQGKDGKVDDI